MKLFNTLTKKKEEFIPLESGKIKMYACGPTVYNYFHIGNARTFMTFDAMRQYFQYRGYEVVFVQNFTDVDDKIIQKANQEGVSSLEISEKYIQAYFKDAASLGILPADFHPKVTETIPEIVQLIDELVKKEYAYPQGGDVYFDVSKFEQYGKLSKQNLEELQCGARIEINEQKKNPLDFALWKEAKPGEPSWESPWGLGRPGWHIECSAMVKKYLGETIDIHGGGGDLVFPHHENEIAQSEAAFGRPFANYWIHVGYLNIENKKMSKSLNNFFTPREIAEEYDLEVIRFFMLSAHYRSPINFSKELVESAQNGLDRLYKAKQNLAHCLAYAPEKNEKITGQWVDELGAYREKFIEVMDEDFNTADGIAVIFELVRHINTHASAQSEKNHLQQAYELLIELTGVLGLLKKEEDEELDQSLEKLVEERQHARKNKDFKRADEIRDQLKAMGIVLEDTPQGVKIVKQEK